MYGLPRIVEYYIARAFYNFKNHDQNIFINQSGIKDELPESTITVECPAIGASGSNFSKEWSRYSGEDRFPSYNWSAPSSVQSLIKEYLIISEDPDAPISTPPIHIFFYGIPATKTSVEAADIALDTTKSTPGDTKGPSYLVGGFRAGKTFSGHIYGAPAPPVGHGPHRYITQVLALKEKIDMDKLSPQATKPEVLEATKGNVVAWGTWTGVYEEKY